MVTKKFFVVLLTFICLVSFVSAETIADGSLKEPNSKRVVLVGKVSLKKPIDLEARREAFNEMKALQVGIKQDNFYTLGETFLGEKNPENKPEYGETFFYVAKKEKDNTVFIDYFIGRIFATVNIDFKFALPANVKITIPEDAQYVYIGNFQYELDYALRTVGFKHIDEYSQAQKELNLATGKKSELYRAEIEFVE